MRTASTQRGFLLIVAVVLIAVAGAMAVVIITLTAGSGQAGGSHVESTQALFIAESGLEKGMHERSLSNAYVGEGPTAMGQGSYTITVTTTDSSGNPLPVGQQRIVSVGQVGNAQRTIEAIVRLAGAMMVYAKETPTAPPAADARGIPFYRRWDSNTNTWLAEAQANDVGPNIKYMVLKFARTRNEAILGTMNSNGQIHVQVWSGAAWGAPFLLATVGGGDSDYRGFDIEYETSGDRAIVVYNDNSPDPNYRIWDGAAWSVATNINISTGGEAVWIELAPHPTSDEIVMITLDNNAEVTGMRWLGGGAPGTVWSNMGVAGVWDAAADSGAPSINPSKVIDVAYEQLSGRAVFMWGDDNNGRQQYRIWDGVTTTLSGIVNLDMLIPGPTPDMTGQADWIRLVAQPGSDNLMYGVQDENRDLFTANWNGVVWGSLTNHDTNTEDNNQRNFDIVFETNPASPGFAWLMWGRRIAGADVTARRQWSPATGWGGIATFGNDAALVQLAAHPSSGVIFAGIYNDFSSPAAAEDIVETHWSGGIWSAQSIIWNGGVVNDPVHERIYVAPERFVPTISWREVFP